MYSGEYDVCDVSLSVYPHTGKLEKYPWPRWESNPRPFDSNRGQAYFSSLPGVYIHSEKHHKNNKF